MGTEPSTTGPKNDFPAVSVGENPPNTPGGNVVETVYEWTGPGKYEKGAKIGSVTITRTNGARFGADFTFDDGDTVRLDGGIPGNGSWKGKGKAGYVRGTGKFRDRTGDLDIESDNPKRWG